MNEIPVRRFCLRVLAFLMGAFFLTSFWSYFQLHSSQFESVFLGWLSNGAQMSILDNGTSRIVSINHLLPLVHKTKAETKPLGVVSSIIILSLPARMDRRQDMNTLRLLLGLPESEWRYTDAVASIDKRVLPVLEWVQYVRSTIVDAKPSSPLKHRFSWPDEKDIDRLVQSDATLDLWDTHPWVSPFGMDLGSGSASLSNWKANASFVPCMIKDFAFSFVQDIEQNTAIRPHKILTPARVACWYSHLEAIQRVANSNVEETAIILEDDVDMESDITEQLELLWENLPWYWDVVFLGHCWSNESYHPPLPRNSPHPIYNLHPSRRPRCTHAYALSRQGARRILLHLRYPPFAFSRAIDQALAWLVESGRIKAFSIVPSLVVQRKVSDSDISGRQGSRWKEKLRKGILECVLGKNR